MGEIKEKEKEKEKGKGGPKIKMTRHKTKSPSHRLRKHESILGTEVIVNYLLPLVTLLIAVVVGGFLAYDKWVVTPQIMARIAELPPSTTHTVKEGDTLWKIALQYYDNRYDIRELVKLIEEANEPLDPGNLRVGRVLIIPRLKEDGVRRMDIER